MKKEKVIKKTHRRLPSERAKIGRRPPKHKTVAGNQIRVKSLMEAEIGPCNPGRCYWVEMREETKGK